MSEANRLLMKRWFEQVWNQKSEAAIDEMFHRQGKSHGFPDADSVLTGPEGFKTVHRAFCGAFPDLHVDVDDIVVEGNRAAVRWHAGMTHLGDHLGFPASHRNVVLAGSGFVVTQDNQIIEAWNFMDLGALMQKLQAK